MKKCLFSVTFYSVQTLFALLFLTFLPILSSAQTLGKYEFTGVSTADNQFNEVTTQPIHATFSSFKRVIAQWYQGENSFNSRYWKSPTNNQDSYIEFSVSAKPGCELNLTQISFDSYRTATGPTKIRITHNASGNFTTDTLGFLSKEGSLGNTVWNFNDIKTSPGGSVTFRIYGYAASHSLGAYRIDNVVLSGAAIPKVKVNEFHYANTVASKTGFVEVVASKDFTNLNAVTLSLYNNAGNVYGTYNLSAFKTDIRAVYGNDRIYYLDIPTGLVNGTGGMSLSSGATPIQFLSYGGSIRAASGPMAGVTSEDIGITEASTDGINNSIYAAEIDNRGFTMPIWTKGTSNNNTKGFANWDVYQTLPVELLYFKANAGNRGVQLHWATASELNNDYFAVEKSFTGTDAFTPITQVKGAGTTQHKQQYRFADEMPLTRTTYYRLKQVDIDGTTSYSPIVAVKPKHPESKLILYPNPVDSQLNIEFGDVSEVKEMQVKIVTLMGEVVYQNTHSQLLKLSNVVVPVANLPAGTYQCHIIRDGIKESKSFIKL